jgi:PAS domain S-box-containing protein
MTGFMQFAEPRNIDTRGLSGRAASILVVDDDPAKRLALVSVLSPLGYSIVEADSGVSALRCIKSQDFAVILLDVRMPIMGGIETAALIRRRRQSEMTPIIFITAHASGEVTRIDPYAVGAVDFIFAPVVPDELRAKVSVFANIFSKAEELASQARAVKVSADQLRLLTDAAPVGIFQTDDENRYVYTNPRWSEITGTSSEHAIGEKWDFIVDPGQKTELAEAAQGNSEHGAELSRRFEIRTPGMATRVVLMTSKPIPNVGGGNSGWVGTLADVTAEAWAEAAMSDARDKATEASRLKSDFLANMSHEIRTPMNGVIGMTDLLLETNLDASQRDYAQTVRDSGETLLTIINDILDFSKIEAGKLEVESVEFEVRGVVDDVVGLLAGPAQAKDLDLIAFVERSVPVRVNGDPGRVRQVLTNLIANAVKFTQTGEIVLGVTKTEVIGTDTTIQFEVTDTGDGIAPDHLDMIFEPFVQADTSTSRKYGGTGLGLAISGQLVALMGGDCGASSRLGSGSTFWFTVCVRVDDGQGPGVPEPGDADLAGVTVIIVDESATQRHVLSECVMDLGMLVSTVDCEGAALSVLRSAAAEGRASPVVVLDRFKPGPDAGVLERAIVLDPALASGLVLMTGLGREHGGEVTLECITCATISKPIRREDLRSCFRLVLGLDAVEAPRETDATHPGPDAGEPTLGRLLLAEDNLVNQKVAVAILTKAGYRVDTVLNGVDAVRATLDQRYDAILMDCQMPELNGYEATAAIRARENGQGRIPIIAMTAGARREDQERCWAEGMDGYLAKPFSKDALLSLVAQSVSRERRRS